MCGSDLLFPMFMCTAGGAEARIRRSPAGEKRQTEGADEKEGVWVFSDEMTSSAACGSATAPRLPCLVHLPFQLDQAVDGVSGETDRMLSSQVTRHRCLWKDIVLPGRWEGGSGRGRGFLGYLRSVISRLKNRDSAKLRRGDGRQAFNRVCCRQRLYSLAPSAEV